MADNSTLPATGDVIAADDIGGVKYQRTKVTYGDDGSATDASLTNPFPVSLRSLSYPASTGNNTTAQLASGASFVGTIETIQAQQAAQISITCDQAYTVQVKQYIDAAGTKLISTDTFTRAAGVPLNENVTLPGDYFNVTITNNGGSTTTTLQCSITFGIMATQPRALTNNGNFPVEAEQPSMETSSYSVSGVIAINTDLLVIDCHQYRSVIIQCSSMGTSGVVTPQWSNDGTNWTANALISIVTSGSASSSFSAAGMWTTHVLGRYLRLRLTTATTGGTTTLNVQGSHQAIGPITSQPVSGTVTVAASTNAVGDVGIQYRANATGAASITSVLSPATPAGASIKGSAGRLLGWQLQNSAAAVRSVKVFNSTSVTMGTTSAAFEIDIPAGGRSEMNLPGGIGFTTGIMWAATGAKGLTDNTAITANDVSGAFFYA